MPQSRNNGSGGGRSALASTTTEVVTQVARSTAGELAKGNKPLSEVARTVLSEAVETIDAKGPRLAEDAGIMNWRYAALGYVTWQVGKRVLKRKAKQSAQAVTPRRSKQEEAEDDG